ncbi:uncharacterized protein LOC120332162 [Styela clava]
MSSSESDDLEGFFASLRPNKDKDKFRLSSGSLDEFVVSDDHVSFDEEDSHSDIESPKRTQDSQDKDLKKTIDMISQQSSIHIKGKYDGKQKKIQSSNDIEIDFSALRISRKNEDDSSTSESSDEYISPNEKHVSEKLNKLSHDNDNRNQIGYFCKPSPENPLSSNIGNDSLQNTNNVSPEFKLTLSLSDSDLSGVDSAEDKDKVLFSADKESSDSDKAGEDAKKSRRNTRKKLSSIGSQQNTNDNISSVIKLTLKQSDSELSGTDSIGKEDEDELSADKESSDSDKVDKDAEESRRNIRKKQSSVGEKFFKPALNNSLSKRNTNSRNKKSEMKHLDELRRRGSFTPRSSSVAKNSNKKSVATPRIVFSSDDTSDEECDVFQNVDIVKNLVPDEVKNDPIILKERHNNITLNKPGKTKCKSLKKSPRVLLPDEDFSSLLDECDTSGFKTKRNHKKSSRILLLADDNVPTYNINSSTGKFSSLSLEKKPNLGIYENETASANKTNSKGHAIDTKICSKLCGDIGTTSASENGLKAQEIRPDASSEREVPDFLLSDEEIVSSAPNTGQNQPSNRAISIISSAKKTSRILVISSDDSDNSDLDNDVIFIDEDTENRDKENLDNNIFESPLHSNIEANSVFDSPVSSSEKKIPNPIPDLKDPEEDDYTPLVARINGGKSSALKDIQNQDFIPPRRKISEPNLGRKTFTPLRKPPKLCYTEKPVKPKTVNLRSNGIPSNIPSNCEKGSGFKRQRELVTKILYDFFNKTIFMDRLPKDMIVEWDKRLTKTAGVTKCSSRTVTSVENGIRCVSKTYKAMISLSEKVLDTLHRLRDTLCHEMCHAAVWLLDNQNDGHGPYWKAWARKATSAHPEMPVVKRCHSYDITYKFHYQCTTCRKIYGRHSKSIKVDKQACGICRGKLVLLPPTKSDGTPAKTRQPNKFAMFVKENYKTVQRANSVGGMTPKHSDVMKALSEKFATLSTKK